MSVHGPEPTIQFIRFVGSGRPPQRADRSACGTLPTRAYRYCEAAATAAGLGWYVFPPLRFRICWSGTELLWTYAEAGEWFPLGAAQFPGFRQHFDSKVPENVAGYSPTFLGGLLEPGLVQVWTGLVVRTKPGWGYIVRSPANLPRADGYEVYEGLVEADAWVGPLFINIRLTRTGRPVEFDPDLPMCQIQPIPREAYTDHVLNDVLIRDFDSMGPCDWRAYFLSVVQPSQGRCAHGAYAAQVRKRRHLDARSNCAAAAKQAALANAGMLPPRVSDA